MGLNPEYDDGQTALDEEEKEGLLLKSVVTRGELDEFEQMNVARAIEWTMTRKFPADKVITEEFVKALHKKMFGDVWKWAGEFRRTNKNMGCDWKQVGTQLKQLNDDLKFWMKEQAMSEEEMAVSYKHRIVCIHCFPNGNGRHSRLIADVIISHIFRKKVFTWGAAGLSKKGEARAHYLKALKKADKGEIRSLVEFASS